MGLPEAVKGVLHSSLCMGNLSFGFFIFNFFEFV